MWTLWVNIENGSNSQICKWWHVPLICCLHRFSKNTVGIEAQWKIPRWVWSAVFLQKKNLDQVVFFYHSYFVIFVIYWVQSLKDEAFFEHTAQYLCRNPVHIAEWPSTILSLLFQKKLKTQVKSVTNRVAGQCYPSEQFFSMYTLTAAIYPGIYPQHYISALACSTPALCNNNNNNIKTNKKQKQPACHDWDFPGGMMAASGTLTSQSE